MQYERLMTDSGPVRMVAAAAGVGMWLCRCLNVDFKRRKSLSGSLVKEDAALDRFAADGALAHSVPA